MAAVADIEIALRRHALRDRRPGDAVAGERRRAVVADPDLVAARRQRLGERQERRLGAAEGTALGRRAVELDAVIGHDDARHSRSPQAAAPWSRCQSPRAAASAISTVRLSISVSVVR